MQFPFRPELVDAAAQDFDAVVRKIKAKNFNIVTLPNNDICKECDIRSFCLVEGMLI
jgi:CRISPR/Cas system-associated exonuclease Cas4 (RecB family)